MRMGLLFATAIVLTSWAAPVQAITIDPLGSSVQSGLNGQVGPDGAEPWVHITGTPTQVYLTSGNDYSKTQFTYNIQGNSGTFVATFDQYQHGQSSYQTDGAVTLTFSVATPTTFVFNSNYTDKLSTPDDPVWTHSDTLFDLSTYSRLFSQTEGEPGVISATGLLPIGSYKLAMWDDFFANDHPVSASGTATFTLSPAVPEPATVWLLLSGLGVVIGWRRWRKAA